MNARTIATCILASIAVAQDAHAEAAPGDFEVFAGAHAMALATDSCFRETNSRTCSDYTPYVGFQLGGQAQLVPWIALGLVVRGSSALDYNSIHTANGVAEPFEYERWLWRGSLRARFDPLLWPEALWLAGELGFAHASEEFNRLLSNQLLTGSEVGFLTGISAGWDIDLYQGFVVGFELQAQMLFIPAIDMPTIDGFERDNPMFPYLALGGHAGYRW